MTEFAMSNQGAGTQSVMRVTKDVDARHKAGRDERDWLACCLPPFRAYAVIGFDAGCIRRARRKFLPTQQL